MLNLGWQTSAQRVRSMYRPLRQRGDTLIGMLLATAIGVAVAGAAVQMQVRQAQIQDAQQGGVLVAQTADGLRRLLSAVPGAPAMLPTSAQTGVNWLKPPACGGLPTNPVQGFVPCSFGDNFWTPEFRTTFTNVAGRIEARLTFVVPQYERGRAGVLADIVAEHANANLTTSALNAPSPGVITSGFVTVMSHVREPDNNLSNRPAIRANIVDQDFARIVVSVSNDSSTDTFLRTDGSNSMQAALNLNNNNLVGGNNLQAVSANLSGLLTADAATARSATLSQSLTITPGGVGAVVNGTCGPNGAIAVAADDGSVLACRGGQWFPAGTQRVGAFWEACNRPGSYGELASDGTGMICQGGFWIPLQARLGGIVQMASFLAVNTMPIPKPNCAPLGAAPRIFVTPRQWFPAGVALAMSGTNLTATPSPTAHRFSAIDYSATHWRVSIQSPRGGDEALVVTACAFA